MTATLLQPALTIADVVSRRQRLVWSDWMLRHAPEILLNAAGLPADSEWFANQRVFIGDNSILYWRQRETQLHTINEHVHDVLTRRHQMLNPARARLPMKGSAAVGSFADRAYRLGRPLLPAGLVDVVTEISHTAALTWWANNGWVTPANQLEVRTDLNEPLRAAQVLKARGREDDS